MNLYFIKCDCEVRIISFHFMDVLIGSILYSLQIAATHVDLMLIALGLDTGAKLKGAIDGKTNAWSVWRTRTAVGAISSAFR